MTDFRATMSPTEFLEGFDFPLLQQLGVLNGKRLLLNGRSVGPLVELMADHGVETLQHGRWFICADRSFCNPLAKDSRYHAVGSTLGGQVREGIVFEGQNPRINPHYAAAGEAAPVASPVIEYDDTIFINEVVSSPENRVNLNIFGLLNVEAFRTWFFDRLDVPQHAILFPTKNVVEGDAEGRPDYEILDESDAFVAYVEVELGGENHEQLARYRRIAAARAGRVISIVGRRSWGGDLSLEEILDHLRAMRAGLPRQTQKYVNAFEAMYCEYVLGRGAISYATAEVSEEMREHRFVRALCEYLPVTFDISTQVAPGEFRMNTKMAKGMSLRVYSPVATGKSLAVASISGGRPLVIFPSRAKLRRYLPISKHAAIEGYVSVLRVMGYDLSELEERQRTTVPLEVVMTHLDPLAEAVRKLGTL